MILLNSTQLANAGDGRSMETMRTQLQQALQANAAEAKKYAWAFPSVGNTDARVHDYLVANPPVHSYEPCLYPEHLREGSALIDRCLARRDQIFGLESTALSTLIEMVLSERTLAADKALAKLSLKASRAQATASATDATDNEVETQFDARQEARAARLALHSQDGSPLNYKQRIDELRTLYADDIRAIHERLWAARVGMHQAGVAPNLPPVPAWNPAQHDNLSALVMWCRNAIRQMELNSLQEVIVKRAFFLGNRGLIPPQELRKKLAAGTAQFTFTLQQGGTPTLFQRYGPHRILNLGVAFAGEVLFSKTANFTLGADARDDVLRDISFEQNALAKARGYGFGVTLGLPEQVADFADPTEATVRWRRPAFDLWYEAPIWEGLATQRYPTPSGSQVLNANPFGEWSLYVNGDYRTPDGASHLNKTLIDPPSGEWGISDIVVYMTIASLQRS